MSLFKLLEDSNKSTPLAARMRPEKLDQFYGQEELLKSDKTFRKMIETGKLSSMILWGPPGCGKTTLAKIISKQTNSYFYELSAVSSGIKDLREIIQKAKDNLQSSQSQNIIFIDEIHRYNKTQQDAILPYIEDGTVVIIGATTENPSFEIVPALRSRIQIIKLSSLSRKDIMNILQSALNDKNRGLGNINISVDNDSLNFIIDFSNGDARVSLNILENASKLAQKNNSGNSEITLEMLRNIVQFTSLMYDKASDEHFDHLSAYQKSLRGSDPDAAIYWLAKMISGGEDPRIIARRLLVCASEDVSNADPMAFILAQSVYESVLKLGLPEARIPLAQATIYVATAPKSNSAIIAIDKAINDINNGKAYPVPMHLKDSHYKDAKKYCHGTDYIYTHDQPNIKQTFLPEKLISVKYYEPKHINERRDSSSNYLKE